MNPFLELTRSLTKGMSGNQFTNQNVMPWWKWACIKHDYLPGVTLYFLSQQNSTSPRFFPLYNESKNIRVVLVKGFRYLPKSDFLYLHFVRVFGRLFSKKFSSYRWASLTDYKSCLKLKTNCVVHLDDPEFSKQEIARLRSIVKSKATLGHNVSIIVTNDSNRHYVLKHLPGSSVKVIPQGFTDSDLQTLSENKFSTFTLVYSSPYIDYLGDKHELHPAWNAIHLIDTLLPEISNKLPGVQVCLIGRIGSNAQKRLACFSNVLCLGLLTQSETARMLRKCHVGIYPRRIDNFRSVQKPYEYLGAGLPTVTYELQDTEVVKRLQIGVSVNSDNKFIDAIRLLSSNNEQYLAYVKRVNEVRGEYNWRHLAQRLDEEFSQK